jgi:hypothetical protein
MPGPENRIMSILLATLISLCGTALTSLMLWPLLRMLSDDMARGLVLLLLPGLATALWWVPEVHVSSEWGRALLRGLCLAPLALVAPLHARARLAPNLRRAAAGLGADARARARLLWWPAYGAPVLLGVVLALVAGLGGTVLGDLHLPGPVTTHTR